MSVSEDAHIALVESVGAAAANRVPLEVTLAALAEEKSDRRLARIAGELAQKLASGSTIDQALTDLSEKLPPELAGFLRAGVESGDVAATFEEFAKQRLDSQRVVSQVRAALAYPFMILAILVPLLLFLSLFIVPFFHETYKEFELDLPPITLVILQTAGMLPAFVGGAMFVVVLLPVLVRFVGGRWLFHRVRIAVPVLGKFWNWSGQREFASLLASFLELRLPLTNAVYHASEIVSDRNIARACPRVIQRLESGESLGAALSHSMHFDRAISGLAVWGEMHNALPDALRMAVELFEDRIQQHAAVVRRLLPPLTLVCVTVLMFFVIVGLMVPLVRLIEGLSM